MTMRFVKSLIVVSLIVGFTQRTNAQGPDGHKLLEFAIASHRNSREAIATLSCTLVYDWTKAGSTTPDPFQSGVAQCWLSADALRLKEAGEKQTDSVWKDGIRKSVSVKDADGQKQVAAGLSKSNKHTNRLDVFNRGQLVLNIPGTIRNVPLEQVVDAAAKTGTVQWISLGGAKVILLELFFEKAEGISTPWRVEFYLDPAVNYLVRKATYRTADARRDYVVVTFAEFPGGVFFPTRVNEQVSRDGEPFASAVSEIKELEVNKPLPVGIFDLRFPQGVIVSDAIRREVYQVDSDGRQISKARKIGAKGPLPPPPPVEASTRAAIGTETLVEPQSWTRWILPFSLALLAIAGLTVIGRRWLDRRAAAGK
jgi:hypothetical protein